jgi:hypothetical protein
VTPGRAGLATQGTVPTPVLIVTTTTRWLGAARTPHALVNAGFEVSLLAPRGALAEHSRYVSKIGYVTDSATAREWVYALAATIRATSPRLILPGDDTALRLLELLVRAPPAQMSPSLHEELTALIVTSLGNPAHYRESIDKTLFPKAVEAFGVRVAPWIVARSVSDVEQFAASAGYPIVLKRNNSWASNGIRICADSAELTLAFAELLKASSDEFDFRGTEGLLAQAYVNGTTKFYTCVAWKGSLVAGYAGEAIVWSEPFGGVPTVNRYYRDDKLRAAAARMIAGFGISGFLAAEFIVDRDTDDAWAIEINRRLVGGSHRGGPMRVDHWTALRAVMTNGSMSTRTDLEPGEEHICVNFPQEWLRDPASHWLREHPVDVPWDEPKLIEAMLKLGKES